MGELMRYTLIIVCILVTFIPFLVSADIINVPGDELTIQAGINEASEGDTVLIQPGIYEENIVFDDENIVVGSLFITTGDTSYISETIIDGGGSGYVVTFDDYENQTSHMIGLSIRNGYFIYGEDPGGGIRCGVGTSPTLQNIFVHDNTGSGVTFDSSFSVQLMDSKLYRNTSSGVYCHWNSEASFDNLEVYDNEGSGISLRNSDEITIENSSIYSNGTANSGGGLRITDSNDIYLNCLEIFDNSADQGSAISVSSSIINIIDVNIHNNVAGYFGGGAIYLDDCQGLFSGMTVRNNISFDQGGGINFGGPSLPEFDAENRCNIYNNYGFETNDIFVGWYVDNPVEIILDTFTVLLPSEYEVYSLFDNEIELDILNGKNEPVNQDLFVSPLGNNANPGTSPDEPLKCISLALAKIVSDSDEPKSIHVADGLYSRSSTGEAFPLNMKSHVSIIGESEDNVILDAEGETRLMKLSGNDGCFIENLTFRNGDVMEAFIVNKGGGVYIDSSSVILNNLLVENCESDWGGGGVAILNQSDVTMTNITVRNCISGYKGGGIMLENSELSMTEVLLEENTARDNQNFWGYGGAIYCSENSSVNVADSQILNNESTSKGGGIYCTSMDSVTISGSTISNNYGSHGGGIYCFIAANFDVINCIFESNVASATSGGMETSSNNTTIESCRFINNSSGSDGGALRLTSTDAVVKHSTFNNNTAGDDAGAVCIYYSDPEFSYCVFSGNESDDGGAIKVYHGEPKITNCTIQGNESNGGGAISAGLECDILLVNSILWNNGLIEIALNRSSSNLYMGHTNLMNGEDAIYYYQGALRVDLGNNMNEDPEFENPEENDFRLARYSPCIDAGTDYLEFNDEVLVEIPPENYNGEAPDLGAIEYYFVPEFGTVHGELIPFEFDVLPPYPNPFNPKTTITVTLPEASVLEVNVFNIIGQKVATLSDGELVKGYHRFELDGSNMSSGVYFVQAHVPGKLENTQRILLIK